MVSRLLMQEAQQNMVWLSHNRKRTASHRASYSFRAFGRSRSLPLSSSPYLDLFLSLSLPSLAPRLSLPCLSELVMAIPGPYSGVSTLAFVARASAFTFGTVYGSIKLSYLRAKAKSKKKADAKGHH
ncbi:unnamed protein product [Musa acuminata subsp. malaccensis]|uniref:(wild Malaysian banana) hypothetical protein n=1 Tax=Musa acuminata subsp. malaccensis TaxID=214687 RepID=A0A804K6U2_MUSAM|nr:unnamed protein product [Musa acuminata subsp. malaccensis]